MFEQFAVQNFTPLSALLGGLLIGAAALWTLASLGRIAGISGMCEELLSKPSADRWGWGWSGSFVLGLVLSGSVAAMTLGSEALSYGLDRSPASLVIAGLLVGFGTRLGGGCTSGHGICGIGRFSRRSIVATCVFMATGIVVATAVTHIMGGAA